MRIYNNVPAKQKIEKLKLSIQLIPVNNWFCNIRLMTPDLWDIIRKTEYRKANYKCDICGTTGRLYCHHKWIVNYKTKTQTLIGFEVLCEKCFIAKHPGVNSDKYTEIIKHISDVNDISIEAAGKLINIIANKWEEDAGNKWRIDISYMLKYIQKLKISNEQKNEYIQYYKDKIELIKKLEVE